MYYLFDGDYLAHRATYMTENAGGSVLDLIECAQGLMTNWMKKAAQRHKDKGTKIPILCMSLFRTPNFRHKIFPQYKESRKLRETPDYLPKIYEAIMDGDVTEQVRSQKGLEADDLMGIYQTYLAKNKIQSCIVTVDKDLNQIPGLHYDPMHESHSNVTPSHAHYLFHRQWLSGDATDCIPGLPGIGEKKAEKLLADVKPCDYEATVIKAYKDRKIKFKQCVIQGQLVKILDASLAEISKTGVKFRMWKPQGRV